MFFPVVAWWNLVDKKQIQRFKNYSSIYIFQRHVGFLSKISCRHVKCFFTLQKTAAALFTKRQPHTKILTTFVLPQEGSRQARYRTIPSHWILISISLIVQFCLLIIGKSVQIILVHNIKLIPLYSYYTEKLFFRQFALIITTL